MVGEVALRQKVIDADRPIMFDKVALAAVVGNEDGAHLARLLKGDGYPAK